MRPRQSHCAPAPAPPASRAPQRASLRTFFALWPDVDARSHLAALARTVAERANGRAPPLENLHLTLAFVGEVPASSVATLRAVGLAAASAAAPFTLILDRIGTFRRTGIAWAGASAVPGELSRLAQCLADALASHGFPIEHRTFAPHVTLARRCRGHCDLAPNAPIAWSADRIVLNVSEQVPGGPRYRELDGWPLQGGNDG